MLVIWCYEYIIQFNVMVPSSSYNTIRLEIGRFWNCHETLSRYDMMKDSSIEIRFGSEICLLSLMFVCCAGDHVAPWQYQHRPGSGIPLLVRALSRWSRNDLDDGPAAWSGPRLGTSRSSTSPSWSPSTRCLYAYLVSQFLHQYRQY